MATVDVSARHEGTSFSVALFACRGFDFGQYMWFKYHITTEITTVLFYARFQNLLITLHSSGK